MSKRFRTCTLKKKTVLKYFSHTISHKNSDHETFIVTKPVSQSEIKVTFARFFFKSNQLFYAQKYFNSNFIKLFRFIKDSVICA